jgi:hypothetical protein
MAHARQYPPLLLSLNARIHDCSLFLYNPGPNPVSFLTGPIWQSAGNPCCKGLATRIMYFFGKIALPLQALFQGIQK